MGFFLTKDVVFANVERTADDGVDDNSKFEFRIRILNCHGGRTWPGMMLFKTNPF